MPASLPPEITSIVERIAAPEPVDADTPPSLTGALRDLSQWWSLVGNGATLAPAEVIAATGAEDTTETAVAAGARAADAAIDSGANLLLPRVRTSDLHAARTLIALLSRKEATAVTAQPAGMPDRAWMDASAAIRDSTAAAAELRGEPLALLTVLHAQEIAFVVGVLLAAAARRTPCIVDGTDTLAAAAVADRISYRAKAWWRAGSQSPDPARTAAIDRIDLTPGLPLSLTDDAGVGASATLALLDLIVARRPTG